MTAIERFQKRVVEMIGEGFRGFHFTAGDKWDVMTTEERCESILQLWDAPKVQGLPISGKEPVDVRKLAYSLDGLLAGMTEENIHGEIA